MKTEFRHLTMQQLKVENVILMWEARTNSRAFRTVLAAQEVKSVFAKPQNIQLFSTISSHKKLYKIQPAAFLITEHIFFEKSDPSFLISSFLKAGLYCTYLMGRVHYFSLRGLTSFLSSKTQYSTVLCSFKWLSK